MENNCLDKVFASPIFWTFLGLQAICTGGFIVLALTTDILYMEAEDSPGPTSIAINTALGVPVACFCFLFAGAAFFNVFHKASNAKKVGGSLLPSVLAKDKVAILPTAVVQEAQPSV